MVNNTTFKSPNNRLLSFTFSLYLFSCLVLLTSAEGTSDDLKEFTKWLHDHGSKFRCTFKSTTSTSSGVEVIAERRIHDSESVFMIPQTLLINSTVIDSSPLGPTLDSVSLTEPIISKEKDLDKQNILHLAQLAIFIHHGVQSKDEMWLPYLKLLMKKKERCNVLWMWTDRQLYQLQDVALSKRAKKWKNEIHKLATNISSKLKATGAFPDGLKVDEIKKAMCLAQSSSFNVTSASGQPVRTLVPGLDLFNVNPDVKCSWWVKDGALRYRYDAKPIEQGDQIFINLSPKADSLQALFEYGVFVPEGSKFVTALRQANSILRRRFMSDLKIRKRIKYSDRFTFKSAALPYFRVEAIPEVEFNSLIKEAAKNETRFQEIKTVIKSPAIYMRSHPDFSCKDEVVALNTLSVHFRDELRGKPTTISEDEKILAKGVKTDRRKLAVSFRLRFKKLVTNFLDITSARSVETKRECLSRAKDEL